MGEPRRKRKPWAPVRAEREQGALAVPVEVALRAYEAALRAREESRR